MKLCFEKIDYNPFRQIAVILLLGLTALGTKSVVYIPDPLEDMTDRR